MLVGGDDVTGAALLERCAPLRRVCGSRYPVRAFTCATKICSGWILRSKAVRSVSSTVLINALVSTPAATIEMDAHDLTGGANFDACERHPGQRLEMFLQRCQQGARNSRTARHATCRARCHGFLTCRTAEVAEFGQRIGRSSSLGECRRMRVSPCGNFRPAMYGELCHRVYHAPDGHHHAHAGG